MSDRHLSLPLLQGSRISPEIRPQLGQPRFGHGSAAHQDHLTVDLPLFFTIAVPRNAMVCALLSGRTDDENRSSKKGGF
jgi:hypothetical protein